MPLLVGFTSLSDTLVLTLKRLVPEPVPLPTAPALGDWVDLGGEEKYKVTLRIFSLRGGVWRLTCFLGYIEEE